MIDEKEKEKWLEQMLEEYPELKYDRLKRYYIEQLIDAYQTNPKAFRENVKQNKNHQVEPKQLPAEIICVSKISAERNASSVALTSQE